jgi:serine phosphatase RsbU (regulator of sigma subunit)
MVTLDNMVGRRGGERTDRRPWSLGGLASGLRRAWEEFSLWKIQDGPAAAEAAILRRLQMDTMYRRSLPNAIVVLANVCIVGILAWYADMLSPALPWLMALAAMAAVVVRRSFMDRGTGLPDDLLYGRLRQGERTTAIIGLMWGCVAVVMVGAGDIQATAVTLVVLTTLTAGGAATLMVLPTAGLAFTALINLPLAGASFAQLDVAGVLTGCAVLMYQFLLIQVIRTGYSGLLKLVRAEASHEHIGRVLADANASLVDTYRELEQDLDQAREMQSQILPSQEKLEALRNERGIRVESHFMPSAKIGGDYWDVRSRSADRVSIIMADFSGHGVRAAINAFRLHALLATRPRSKGTITEAGSEINRKLCRLLSTGQYATMFLGRIDLQKGELFYTAAASPSPLLMYPGSDEISTLNTSGLPMGIAANAEYAGRSAPFRQGSLMLLFSDALYESRDPSGEMLGLDWVKALMRRHVGEHGATGLVDAVVAEFKRLSPGTLEDDLTIVAIHNAGMAAT